MCRKGERDMSRFLEGQTHQLMDALERAGFKSADITRLAQSGRLRDIRAFARGQAEIVDVRHVVEYVRYSIDLDADPFTPVASSVVEHRQDGQIKFDPQQLALHLDQMQRSRESMRGVDLRQSLADHPVLNANALGFLLDHPYFIPEDWKQYTSIVFWGTIYADGNDGLFVRCLYYHVGRDCWEWCTAHLDHLFDSGAPAAVYAGELASRHVIDCDADPIVPDSRETAEHQKGGQFEWDSAKVALHLDEQQQGGVMIGEELREKLRGQSVLNANVLDYLLVHPYFIPEEWKNQTVFFWGTVYLVDGQYRVRCLKWDGSQWSWDYRWIVDVFDCLSPAAVCIGELASRHIIDCDADSMLPDGWQVVEHRKGGQLKWDAVEVALYLDEAQQGGAIIAGEELRKKLQDKPVLNANVLDYLLANPRLIPEEWKGKTVLFWGTIYRHADGSLFVRCLSWSSGRWHWDYGGLSCDFRGGDRPAAVLAA